MSQEITQTPKETREILDRTYHMPDTKLEDLRLDLTIPLKTVSELNNSDHWAISSKRHKKQKKIVHFELMMRNPNLAIPCNIFVQRQSCKELDYDNLVSSFKWIVDAICEYITPGLAIGQADGNRDIKIFYSQIKVPQKQFGINIKIYCQ